jgi:hypothetical protein
MKKELGIFVLALVLAVPGFAEKVSGKFKTSKSVIKPTAVAAFPARSMQDPLNPVTALVLSEGTMNVPEALQDLQPLIHLSNQEGMRQKNIIIFFVRPDGYVHMTAIVAEGNVHYIDSTKDKTGEVSILAESLDASLTENSSNRLAGRIRTTKPTKTMGGKEIYELDVEFDTPVTRPQAAKKLSSGGGDPGKALMTLFAAMHSKNWKGVQAGVSSRILESETSPDATDAENLTSVVDLIGILLPKGKNVKVLGGEEFSDRAVLELQEGNVPGDSILYLIKMVKEPSGWRFDRSTMFGLI